MLGFMLKTEKRSWGDYKAFLELCSFFQLGKIIKKMIVITMMMMMMMMMMTTMMMMMMITMT